MKKTIFILLAIVLVIFGLFSWVSVVYPTLVSIILNVFWLALLTTVIIFFTLGILVFLGLRKEVNRLLDILLEGSLTLVDVIAFIKRMWYVFVSTICDFLLFISPLISYSLSLLVYVGLIVLYKSLSRTNDVTLLSCGLTVGLISIVALLNLPRNTAQQASTWGINFRKKLITSLSDSFEIMIIVFFFTMDSVNLFFLPQELRVPITAQVGYYDLMVRGFIINDHLKITINLIMVAIIIEIVRNMLRIVAVAVHYYRQRNYDVLRSVAFKEAVRESFNEAKDDIVKFISFTTFLVAVFLLLPRLKLVAMAVASVTSLALDLLIPHRLTQEKGSDLISRLLARIFRI